MERKVLVISFSDLNRDPRVYRQLSFLKNKKYNITSVGFVNSEIDDIAFIQVHADRRKSIKSRVNDAISLKTRRFEQYYWSSSKVNTALSLLSGNIYDLIIANDINSLPLAVKLARTANCKVLLDAHEYEPKHFDEKWSFRFFFEDYWDYICRKYLPCVDAMITVCDGIASEYRKNYGIDCSVITNAPFFKSLNPSSIDSEDVRMIHHGGVNRTRQLENMINLMDVLDERFTLDFMLLSNQTSYLEELKRLGSKNPRVNFIEPVAMQEIAGFINQYDIGLYMLSPNSFNCRMALPNKFFEFIQGRLAVATWPSPEVAKLVHQYSCGVISDEYSIQSMADSLNELTSDDLNECKVNADIAANDLCAESNFKTFGLILCDLL